MKDSFAPRKLLVLGDRFASRHKLINLGEGAKWDGLYQLLQKKLNFEILPGPWKPFPYLNIRKFRRNTSKDIPEKVFMRALDKIDSFSRRRIHLETSVFHFIENHDFSKYSRFKKLGDKFERKFNRGVMETLTPYVFRAYHSQSLLSRIRESDLVLFQSDVFADHVKEYMPSFVFEILLAKKSGKKVISINQTVDISDPLALAVATLGLKNIDLHLVREPLSREFLLKVGVEDSKILVTADSAFAMEMPEEKRSSAERKGVGLLIRGDRTVDGGFWKRMIQTIHERHRQEVFHLFTCKPQDSWVFKELGGQCRLHPLPANGGHEAFVRLLKQFNLVITDRFHGAVFSIVANTPVIPLAAKSHKMEGLFSMFDYPFGVLEKSSGNYEKDLLDRVDIVFRRQDEIRDQLSKASRDLKAKAESGMEMIKVFYERHGRS